MTNLLTFVAFHSAFHSLFESSGIEPARQLLLVDVLPGLLPGAVSYTHLTLPTKLEV